MASKAEKEGEPLRFVRDDQDRVVMIREGERVVLGGLAPVGGEMARFLAEIDCGIRPSPASDADRQPSKC